MESRLDLLSEGHTGCHGKRFIRRTWCHPDRQSLGLYAHRKARSLHALRRTLMQPCSQNTLDYYKQAVLRLLAVKFPCSAHRKVPEGAGERPSLKLSCAVSSATTRQVPACADAQGYSLSVQSDLSPKRVVWYGLSFFMASLRQTMQSHRSCCLRYRCSFSIRQLCCRAVIETSFSEWDCSASNAVTIALTKRLSYEAG